MKVGTSGSTGSTGSRFSAATPDETDLAGAARLDLALCGIQEQLDLAAHQVGERDGRVAVRDVDHFHARHRLQQLGGRGPQQ
jgi:hypothetical protein